MPILSTVNQFSEKYPAFTKGGLRSLIFNSHQNGLSKTGAIIRIGRKIVLNEERFFSWWDRKTKERIMLFKDYKGRQAVNLAHSQNHYLNANCIKKSIDPKCFYENQLQINLSNKNGWIKAGLCPYHDDRQPGSFFINTEYGGFKCFSCGVTGGDIIDFMTAMGFSFKETMNFFAREWGVQKC